MRWNVMRFNESERGQIPMHDATAEQRYERPRVRDLSHGYREQVAVEHDEIGSLAHLDRSGFLLDAVDPGRVDGESRERFRQCNALLRQEGLGRRGCGVHARHGDLELLQRIGTRDGPVAAEGYDRAAAVDAGDRVEPARALWAEERDRQLRDVIIGKRP